MLAGYAIRRTSWRRDDQPSFLSFIPAQVIRACREPLRTHLKGQRYVLPDHHVAVFENKRGLSSPLVRAYTISAEDRAASDWEVVERNRDLQPLRSA